MISGEKEKLAEAVEELKNRGMRKVIVLNVAGAFHSRLMAPAGEALKPVLEATPMTVPAVPVYHNYTAAPAKDAAELRANLAAQVAGSVRWEECVRAMVAAGGDAMIEFGAGRCPMCRTSMSTAWSRSTRSLSEGTGPRRANGRRAPAGE